MDEARMYATLLSSFVVVSRVLRKQGGLRRSGNRVLEIKKSYHLKYLVLPFSFPTVKLVNRDFIVKKTARMGDSAYQADGMISNQDDPSGGHPEVVEMKKLLKSKNEHILILQEGLNEERKKNTELSKKVSLLEDETFRLKVQLQMTQLNNLRSTSVPVLPPLPLPNPVAEGQSVADVVEGTQSRQDGQQNDLRSASEESMQEIGDDDVVPLEIENMDEAPDVTSNVIGNGRPQRVKKPPARLRCTVKAVHHAAGKNGNMFLCKCQQKFKTKNARSTHIQMRNDSWKCICASCGEKFSDRKQLEEHFRSTSNNCTSQSGPISGRKMNQKKVQREIAKRKKQHGLCPQNGKYKWMCDCGLEFESEKDFKNHEKREEVPKKFLCAPFSPGCNQTFTHLSTLRNHLRSAHKLNLLAEFKKGCGMCGMMFKTDDEFKTHKRQPNCSLQGQADLVPQAHPLGPLPTPSPAVVTEPPRHPPTAQNMTDYQRPGTSASAGPASVPLPRKISATALSGNLATPALPFRCACGISFPTESFLTGHIMGLKGALFECNSCGEVFIKDEELTQHIFTTALCNHVKVRTCFMCHESFQNLKVFNHHKYKCTHYPI